MLQVTVCPGCDLAHRPSAPPRHGLHCTRCNAPLQRPDRAAIDSALAVAASALVLFILANVYPLVAMHVNGTMRETTLAGAARGLYAQGYRSLAALVFATTIIAPAIQVVAMLYVLPPLRRGRPVPHQNTVIRVLTRIRSWSFIEVFMLGSVVALVRLAKFSVIVPGVALWACALLMMALSALMSIATPEQMWRWVEQARR